MGRGLKIFLWILGILLVILAVLGIYAYYSYKQITAVASVATDESFQQNALALAKGDCSKYTDVEARFNEMKITIKSACANPGVKILIEKQMEQYKAQAEQNGVNASSLDICNEIDNPDNLYMQYLEQAKTNCNLTA